MKKSIVPVIYLLLFFMFCTRVFAAVDPGGGGGGGDPAAPVIEPSDAAKMSTYDGSFYIALTDVQNAVGQKNNIFNSLYTVRNLLAMRTNEIVYSLVGELGMYPGKTRAEILEQDLSKTNNGLAYMAYDSAYSLLQSSPSQNIAGYYADMLLPGSIVGSQTSVYADNCTPYNPGVTATPYPTGDYGVLTKPPSCEGTSTYWKVLSLSNLWSISFTIAMGFVVMVLVYAGFMMMFRKEASGQGLVTISMALQNVIVGSVMALLSFAMGAFFLNLSKFLTLLVADMFNQLMWNEFDPTILTKWIGFKDETANTYISSPLSVFTKFVFVSLYGDYLAGAKNLGALQDLLPISSQALSGNVGGAGASARMWFWDNLPTAQFWLKSPLYLIGRIIGAGLLLWYSVRIWWETLKTFLFMVGDTLMAPITFVLGSIPGVWQGKSVTLWFKRMLKNSLKAPTMFALVNVAGYVTISLALKTSTVDPLESITGGYYGAAGGMSVANLVSSSLGFIASGVGPNFIAMLAILSFVPKVPAFLDEAMDEKGGLSLSPTVAGGLSSFNAMVVNQADRFTTRGTEAYQAERKAGRGFLGAKLVGNNKAIGEAFRSNFVNDPLKEK